VKVRELCILAELSKPLLQSFETSDIKANVALQVPARRTFEVPAEICKAKAQALLVRRRRQLPADFISEGKTGALKQTGMPLRSSFQDERMGKDGTGPQSCCLRTTELSSSRNFSANEVKKTFLHMRRAS